MRSWVIVVAISLVACSRPKPPTIVPEKATVLSVGVAGVQMKVELGIDNPNGIDIAARSVSAEVLLDGKHALGQVTVPHEFKLPAKARSHLEVPLVLQWKDVSLLLALAGSNRSIPYDVDGKVSLGGDLVEVEVPFRLHGEVTHEQLVQATLNSIPRLLP